MLNTYETYRALVWDKNDCYTISYSVAPISTVFSHYAQKIKIIRKTLHQFLFIHISNWSCWSICLHVMQLIKSFETFNALYTAIFIIVMTDAHGICFHKISRKVNKALNSKVLNIFVYFKKSLIKKITTTSTFTYKTMKDISLL